MATTAQHVNVQNARRAYDAFAKGDMQTVGELMADNIVWHVAGGGVISGDYKGKDAVLGFFVKLAQWSLTQSAVPLAWSVPTQTTDVASLNASQTLVSCEDVSARDTFSVRPTTTYFAPESVHFTTLTSTLVAVPESLMLSPPRQSPALALAADVPRSAK